MKTSGDVVATRKYGPSELGLAAVAGSLCLVIAMWPGGVMQFMQGIADEADLLSISILASLIGALFILLFRLGVSLAYVEEIGTTKGRAE